MKHVKEIFLIGCISFAGSVVAANDDCEQLQHFFDSAKTEIQVMESSGEEEDKAIAFSPPGASRCIGYVLRKSQRGIIECSYLYANTADRDSALPAMEKAIEDCFSDFESEDFYMSLIRTGPFDLELGVQRNPE